MWGTVTAPFVLSRAATWALAFVLLCMVPLAAQETEKSGLSTSPSADQAEGCKLHPYTGKTPLNQMPNHVTGAEDLRGGMTCRFRIHPKGPVLVFHFAGKDDNSFGNLEIQQESGIVIQTIENETDPGAVTPATAQTVLQAVDANFDGYKDLQLLSNCGATGNYSYDFYLFDPASGRFVHNDFLTNLTSPSFDAATGQVTSSSNSSASDWETETYQHKDGQYTLIRKQTSEWDRDRHVVNLKTYERRNGRLELIDSSSTPE
jgi:hypothetical protein